MVRILDKTYKYNGDPSRAALKTLGRFLLQRSQSNNNVTRAISRVQCVNALQVVLDTANEKVLKPEESYTLRPNYKLQRRRQKSVTLLGNSWRA